MLDPPTDAGRGRAVPPAKVTVPRPVHGWVPRPRAAEAVAAEVGAHRLVLVCASAGYGKTTLVAEWARARGGATGWASLDTLDDDRRRLATVLLDALARSAGDLAPPPDRSGWADGELVDTLVEVASHAGAASVLVLDDVHRLSVATARQVLGPLLELTDLHLVLVARHDTAIPLQRLRAAGGLGEIRQDVLGFTEPEVAGLARHLGVSAADDRLHELWELTDGWPVAVRLAITAGVLEPAGHSLRRLRDRDVPLAGYLVEEIVDDLPPELTDFVLRAGCAEVLDARLAADLVPGGARLLDEVVRRGLFLTPVSAQDDGVVLYRWHPLVAAHVRAVLLRRDPQAARVAHRVVAEHVAQVDPASGIAHALDAAAPDVAARILDQQWPDLLVRGDPVAVRRLRGALPNPFRDGPEALLALCAADTAEDEPGPAGACGTGVVGELLSTFVAHGRPPLGESVRRGRELLDRADVEDATRALGEFLLGRAQVQQPVLAPDAMPRLRRAEQIAVERGWTALALACRAEQSLVLAREGRHIQAARRAAEVLLEAHASGWSRSAIVAGAFLARGIGAYWRDELPLAREQLTCAMTVCASGRRETVVQAATALAAVCLAEGDAAGFARARDVVDAPWPARSAPEHLPDVRALLTGLQLGAEAREADALAVLARRTTGVRSPLALVWQSHLLRRTGDRGGAREQLRAARAALRPGPAPAPAETVVALHAAWALLLDDPARQHRALEDALDAVWPEQVVRPLCDLAVDLQPLLSAHLEWGTAHEALVVHLLQDAVVHPPGRVSSWELTGRELDVLTCLRSTMTAEEIAASLFLSVNTVKTHIRAIYRKLGAHGRRSAVQTAVQRGLL